MTDQELLELSAKACGMTLNEALGKIGRPISLYSEWNPLADDGDAMRLAVRLSIPVSPEEVNGTVWVCRGDIQVFEPLGIDPEAATRRAIVRAAAEIGKNMK